MARMHICDTCGAWGHTAESCPLRRLQEQQVHAGPQVKEADKGKFPKQPRRQNGGSSSLP